MPASFLAAGTRKGEGWEQEEEEAGKGEQCCMNNLFRRQNFYMSIFKKKKKKEELRKIPYSSSHPDTQQNSSVSAALYLYSQMPESKRKNTGYEKHCTCKHRLTPTSGVMLQILQRSLGEDQQEEEAAGHPTHSSWKSHGPLYKVHTVISLFYFNASH